MHQIKNVIIDLDEVRSIKQTKNGLEFSFKNIDEPSIARGAKLSDLVNALDIETLLDAAIKVESECGFRVSY
jgi:hypothetical protein